MKFLRGALLLAACLAVLTAWGCAADGRFLWDDRGHHGDNDNDSDNDNDWNNDNDNDNDWSGGSDDNWTLGERS